MSGPRIVVQPLVCPRCAAEVAWEDVSEPSRTALCRRCKRVIDLTGGARQAAPEARARPAQELVRGKQQQPREVTLVELPGELRIEAPEDGRFLWRAWGALVAGAAPLAAYALLPDGGAAHGVGLAIAALLTAGALVSAWLLAAGFLNRLRVTVKGGTLTVGPGPIPFFGRRRWAKGELTQLYVEERASTREKKKETRRRFALMGLLASGERVEVVAELDSVGQALWLEQRLERALRIVDVPVRGEVARSEPVG